MKIGRKQPKFVQFPVIFTLCDNSSCLTVKQTEDKRQPIRMQLAANQNAAFSTLSSLMFDNLPLSSHMLDFVFLSISADHSKEDKNFGLKIKHVMSIFIKILSMHQMYLIINHWKIQKPMFDRNDQYLLLWLLLAQLATHFDHLKNDGFK